MTQTLVVIDIRYSFNGKYHKHETHSGLQAIYHKVRIRCADEIEGQSCISPLFYPGKSRDEKRDNTQRFSNTKEYHDVLRVSEFVGYKFHSVWHYHNIGDC